MICVYPANCTDFSTNGNGTIEPSSAQVTDTLNGEYELQLVHPIDEAGKWQRLVEGCILRAPVPAATTPRVHFSAPGDDSGTEIYRINTDFAGTETRKGTLNLRSGPGRNYKIRNAFNSPMRPFVLATTSIGQEGLDFHPYCRKIMHWNLPSNPIDLEQREGRINRYKCLAIRQDLSQRYADYRNFSNDVWQELFDMAAVEIRTAEQSDLVP